MAVKLVIDDPKKDQLVPVKALKEFGSALDREAVQNASFMEKMFKSEEKRKGKKEKIKAIAEAIAKLGSAPDNKRAWFAKFFLVPFEGKASKEAKELFEAISKTKGFEALQSSTNEYNKTFKANTDATATAAANLTSVLEKTLTPTTAQFAEAYKAQQAQAAAQAQAGAAGSTNAPVAAPAVAPAQQAVAPQGQQESILKSFNLDKKLYEAGLITDSEYLASLTQTKNGLLEKKKNKNKNKNKNNKQPATGAGATTPAATAPNAAATQAGAIAPQAPAAAPAAAPPAADPVLSGLSTLTGQTKPEEGELVKLAKDSASFQQVMTDLGKTVITEALTPKQKQLVKLNVQKQVLAEYIKTGEVATKTQLNEFFLMALLLAALAAAAGWAIKTLGPILANSLTGTEPSGRSKPNDSTKDASNIAAALGAGYSPNGQMTDVNGQTVGDVQQVIDSFKATLTEKQNVITSAVATIKQTMQAKTPQPPTYGPFDQAFANSPATEINALNAALEKLKTY